MMGKGEPTTFAEPVSHQRLRHIDEFLAESYGRPQWRSHGDPLDELIATVLSQHTSDINTERAFTSLKSRFPEWRDIIDAPTAEVADAIHCGGLANTKAPRIQRILSEIEEQAGVVSLEWLRIRPLDDARRWLCQLPGVGPKTAACVLLFSLGLPDMPVDTHVHRVSRRLGLIDGALSASEAHISLNTLLSGDRDLTYSLHLNLIQHGRAICKARIPRCSSCILANLCPSANVSLH